MKDKNILVHIAGVTVMLLFIAAFVHINGLMQFNRLLYGVKINPQYLPVPTSFFFNYSFLGYALPILAGILTFLVKKYIHGDTGYYMICCLWLLGVIALGWLLISLLAWQLPLYYPVAIIK
jgi:hypothetical protein